MNAQDRNEVRAIMIDVLRPTTENIVEIRDHLHAINGNITKHQEFILTHELSCPKGDKIESIERNLAEYNFIKKNPLISAVALLVILIGILFMGVSYISEHKANKELMQNMKSIMYNTAPDRGYKK